MSSETCSKFYYPSLDLDLKNGGDEMSLEPNMSPKSPVARGAVSLVRMASYDVERESTLKRISRDLMQKTPGC